jgi:hypothetical protein
MNGNVFKTWIVAIFLVALAFFNILCFSDNSTDSASTVDEPSDQNIDKLYLSRSAFLLPNPPDDDPMNKTTIAPGSTATYGHNLRDRKLNKDLNPELDLWIDTKGQSGLVLHFEIGFQAWEDDTLMNGQVYNIEFENYTTVGGSGPEHATVPFIKYIGEPYDIKHGSKNWASIYFSINFTENSSASSIDILSGAGGKTSFIKLPFDQTLSAFEHEQSKDKDKNNTPGFTGELFIVSFVAIIALIALFKPLRRKQLKR